MVKMASEAKFSMRREFKHVGHLKTADSNIAHGALCV